MTISTLESHVYQSRGHANPKPKAHIKPHKYEVRSQVPNSFQYCILSTAKRILYQAHI